MNVGKEGYDVISMNYSGGGVICTAIRIVVDRETIGTIQSVSIVQVQNGIIQVNVNAKGVALDLDRVDLFNGGIIGSSSQNKPIQIEIESKDFSNNKISITVARDCWVYSMGKSSEVNDSLIIDEISLDAREMIYED